MWSIVHVCRWWVQQLWGRGRKREREREGRGGGEIEMSVYEFVCWERIDFPWVSMECDLVDQTWGVTSVFPLLSWTFPSTMLAALSLAMCSTKAMRGRRRTAGVVLSGFSVTGVALVFWSCSWTWSRHTERDSLSVGKWHWSLNRTEDTHWGRNVATTVPASQVTERAVLWALTSLLEESAVQRWLGSSRVWGSPPCWCWHVEHSSLELPCSLAFVQSSSPVYRCFWALWHGKESTLVLQVLAIQACGIEACIFRVSSPVSALHRWGPRRPNTKRLQLSAV